MKQEKTKTDHIRLALSDVRKSVRDLETLVVSFDRLGSVFYDDPKHHAAEMDKFLKEVAAFKILARMRRVFWDACDAQLTKAQVQGLEKSLKNARIWGKTD